jgi:hypothetical protein
VNGLQERYGAQIDFIHLDIDQGIVWDVMDRYGMRGRNEYVLLDAEGNILQKWYGSLSSILVSNAVDEYLATQGESPG